MLVVLLGVFAKARSTSAHDPFEVTTEALVDGRYLTLEVTMNVVTAEMLLQRAHAKLNPTDSGRRKAPLPKAQARSEQFVEAADLLFAPSVDGKVLERRGWAVLQGDDPKDVTFRLMYRLAVGNVLSLRATHLELLSEGYTSALSLKRSARSPTSQPMLLELKVLHSNDTRLEVALTSEAPLSRSSAETIESAPDLNPRALAVLWRFFELGFTHMLAGYDHLLFLAGIVLGCTRLRAMLLLVSAFTVAHTLSLATAALGWLALPATWVELLIAASIVYVGVENLIGRVALKRRVVLAFGFGLIHGLGFATGLRELGLQVGDRLLVALLGFNVGLEVAQLVVALAGLPLLLLARSRFRKPERLRWASVAVSAAGGYWLFTRVVTLAA